MEIPTTIHSTSNFKKGTMIIVNIGREQITYAIILDNNKRKKELSVFCFNRKNDSVGPAEIEWQTIITYQQLDKYLSDKAYEVRIIL